MLFRETDRVQRLNSSLCLFCSTLTTSGTGIRAGADACDELLVQVANRASRLLRSYDLLGGRNGRVPGGGAAAASTCHDAGRKAAHGCFSSPFHVRESRFGFRVLWCSLQRGVRRSCFARGRKGAAAGQERRSREHRVLRGSLRSTPGPVAFLSPSPDDELLAGRELACSPCARRFQLTLCIAKRLRQYTVVTGGFCHADTNTGTPCRCSMCSSTQRERVFRERRTLVDDGSIQMTTIPDGRRRWNLRRAETRGRAAASS